MFFHRCINGGNLTIIRLEQNKKKRHGNISDLVNEISEESPCGSDLEYDSGRLALNDEIQGTPEDQFSGQKFEPPNWREIQKQAISLREKV